jgi:hypothetical protein
MRIKKSQPQALSGSLVIFVPILAAWAGSIVKIALFGPPFDRLSESAFFWIFGPLFLGPFFAFFPRFFGRLRSSRAEPLVITALAAAAAIGLGLYVVGQDTGVALFLLALPVYQYILVRQGFHFFQRRYGRLPPEAILMFPTIVILPKGTPFADRTCVAGLFLLSFTPVILGLIAIS